MNYNIKILLSLTALALILGSGNSFASSLKLKNSLESAPPENKTLLSGTTKNISLTRIDSLSVRSTTLEQKKTPLRLVSSQIPQGTDANLNSSLGSTEDSPQDDQFVLLANYRDSNLALNAVNKQIRLFTEIFPDKFSQWLERSGKYKDLIQSILRMNGLPEDLVFLPLIESGYNPYAYSRARAVGPWQFIKGTALKYGLKVDFWVDERRDPVKSTHAASRYLGELYVRFESWALAMAAYNAGEGRIERALRKSKSDDYWPLLRTRYLRSETKNYVAKFIAARQIASDPEGYGFSEIEYHRPFEFDEVEVPSPLDLEVIATASGTTYEVIKELNPELRAWCTPLGASSYVVRVPKGATETFLANLNTIPEEERLTLKQYTVKRGDTLVKIAKTEGVPMEVLLAINGLKKSGPVPLGTVLYLPPKDKIKLCSDIVKSQKTYHKKKRSKKLVT